MTSVQPLHDVAVSDSSAKESLTLYLLVQELVGLIEVPATREVWVTASAGEEVATTPCRNMIHNSTAWNDILEIKLPTASPSNVHIAVWSRSNDRKAEPLPMASGEFEIQWTSEGFSDERLSLDSRLRLRLAVSWQHADVEMLQRGLVPLSPHRFLKSVTLQP